MTTEFTLKQPYEEYAISFDFTPVLGVETIASAAITAIDQANLADVSETLLDAAKQTNSATVVYGWVQDGTSGHEYLITCRVVGSADSQYELDGILPVNDLEEEAVVISTSTRQDYITAIGHLVGGDLPLDEAEKIFAINAALKKYSGHRPRIVVEKEDGNGSFDYALTLLAEWAEGFSTIKSVEYPVDDTDETAAILQDDAWQIYRKPTGKVLRFLEASPAATEDIRITYTALHTCTDAACTVPPYDEETLQILAASIFCDMLAASFAQTQDSTIQADSVDHKSKASEYAARARAYRKMYFDHLGIKEGETPAASVTRGQTGSWANDRITSGRR